VFQALRAQGRTAANPWRAALLALGRYAEPKSVQRVRRPLHSATATVPCIAPLVFQHSANAINYLMVILVVATLVAGSLAWA